MGVAAVAALGPYFASQRHAPGAGPGAPWRPLSDLLDGDGPGGVRHRSEALDERVAAMRAALAAMGDLPAVDVPPRVAGSVLHLGLVARLVSPVLGAAALTGSAPLTDPETFWWKFVLGGPLPVSLPDVPDVPAGEALSALLAGPLEGLRQALENRGVPATVLRGNVASAVNGAYGQLVARRPELAPAARAAAAELLGGPALAGAWEGACGPGFRRRSCCLIYQLAPRDSARRAAAYCGDCVLR